MCIFNTMTFLIKFIRSDALLFERKIEFIPVEAEDREHAVASFLKFLGTPFGYRILDVSVLEYE